MLRCEFVRKFGDRDVALRFDKGCDAARVADGPAVRPYPAGMTLGSFPPLSIYGATSATD